MLSKCPMSSFCHGAEPGRVYRYIDAHTSTNDDAAHSNRSDGQLSQAGVSVHAACKTFMMSFKLTVDSQIPSMHTIPFEGVRLTSQHHQLNDI